MVKSARFKIAFNASLVACVACLYYLTGYTHIYYHVLFRDLYFLPLILAGFWFGLRGAAATALAITFCYLPFLVANWQDLSPADFGRILEILLFNAISVVFGVMSDREKAVQKALRETESLAAMGRALSAVSHDVRGPISAIGAISRLMQKRLKGDEEHYAKLGLIVRTTERIEGMLKNMLDFSRPLKLTLAGADLNKVVADGLSILEDEATKKNVTIEVSPHMGLRMIDLDAMRMEQVVVNLVMNAIQASSSGQKVRISTGLTKDAAILEVADNGTGIPDGHRDKMFLPFFTTKTEGTGLGLSIVSKIVEAHGGTIKAADLSPSGVAFRVFLPFER